MPRRDVLPGTRARLEVHAVLEAPEGPALLLCFDLVPALVAPLPPATTQKTAVVAAAAAAIATMVMSCGIVCPGQ